MIVVIVFFIILKIFTHNNNIYSNYTYLDNNATTKPCNSAIIQYNKNIYLGNASAIYATKAKKILAKTRLKVLECAGLNPTEYLVIFTSGASESINTFINTIMSLNSSMPIITSLYEHKTTLECVKKYPNVTYVAPNIYGNISKSSIVCAKPYLVQKPALVSLIMAHNEIGSVNWISKEDMPSEYIYHADVVQAFGKYLLVNADAYSISFHKLYGFPSCGALIITNKLYNIFKKSPQICGEQNYNLRGGTENIATIASIYGLLTETFTNRVYKNALLNNKKNYIIQLLLRYYPIVNYGVYCTLSNSHKVTNSPIEFCIISYDSINTIFLSAIGNAPICKNAIQTLLLRQKVIIGLGSACSNGKDTNYVLESIKLPSIIRQSIIRISLADYTTYGDCKKFVACYLKALHAILSR